jgi:hypothetical protein
MLAARAEPENPQGNPDPGKQLSLSITRQAPAVSDRTWPEKTPLHPAAKRDFRPIRRQCQDFEAPTLAEAEFFRTYSVKPKSFAHGDAINNLQAPRNQWLMTPRQFASTHILS